MPTFGASRVLRISVLLVGSLLIGGIADAGKRYQDVDWSEFIESPEERARWDARAKARPGEENQAQAEKPERSEKANRRAKKAKKAKGGKKARKAAAAARKKRNR